jgi:hypothetical protein
MSLTSLSKGGLYWGLAGILVIFGFVAIFSMGKPFLTFGGRSLDSWKVARSAEALLAPFGRDSFVLHWIHLDRARRLHSHGVPSG